VDTQKIQIVPAPPVHPLGAFVTVVLDWVWASLEIPSTISIALLPTLIPLSLVLGLLCLVSVAMIQKFVSNDSWSASIAKGLVMGIAAGVPYPVVGTMVGGPLLIWSGIRGIQSLLSAPEI
jgi:hypothetical protein